MTAKHERPLLYVLATQPSTPNQATTSEWIIELFKPPPTGLKPLSTVSHPKQSPGNSSSKHHHFPSFGLPHKARHQHEESTETISPTASPQATSQVPEAESNETMLSSAPPPPSEPERIIFSRLDQGSSSISQPIILRIAVASIPYQHSHQITSDLDAECTSALETVHTTPDSSSWLRQGLLALQGKGILPPVSHDFDVTKFLSVADDCLEKTLLSTSTESGTQRGEMTPRQPREVRYWRLLGGLDDEDGGDVDLNVDGQARDWSLPHRERKSVAEKGAGSDGAGSVGGSGFWISHGPLAERTRAEMASFDDKRSWERGGVYGGLM